MLCFVVCMVAAMSAVVDTRMFHGRIMGGQETSIERFPHQISFENKRDHFCGGAVLSEKHIITASHCFPHGVEKGMKARIGSSYRKKGGKLHDIASVAAHPRPGLFNFDADVAIVVVTPNIVFSDKVRPIQPVPLNDQPKPGDILTFTGWGITEPYESTKPILALSDRLRAVDFPMLENDYCRQVYHNFKTKYTENMICGGGGGKIAAGKGDSGGPLINQKNQLVGIVSWGHPKFPMEEPSVFTNLAGPKVRKFIDEYFNKEMAKRRPQS